MKTETTKFLLPLLYEDYTFYNCSCFINCYIGDLEKPEFDTNLFILSNHDTTDEFNRFSKRLKEFLTFKTTYSFNDDQVVFVFDIQNEYLNDVQLFINGEFSKLSDNYKQRILNFYKLKSKNNPIYGILYHTEEGANFLANFMHLNKNLVLKAKEYWYQPSISKEVLNYIPNVSE